MLQLESICLARAKKLQDFRTLLLQFKAKRCDAVFFMNFPNSIAMAFKQAQLLGIGGLHFSHQSILTNPKKSIFIIWPFFLRKLRYRGTIQERFRFFELKQAA